MFILGYASAVIMGGVLGLLGGGGSILTIPILVYIFGITPSTATGYSLFIVGLSAAFGAVHYAKKKQIDYKVGVIFTIPAFIGVYIARSVVVPNIPPEVFTVTDFVRTKDTLILVVFATMMILASISMIKGRKESKAISVVWDTKKIILISVEGLAVGGLTGFVGAGGGFLIIPALVVLAGLEMKVAVGTSLVIISIKSLIGFLGDVQHNPNIDWNFLLVFCSFSIIGIFIGGYLSKHISSKKLKPIFGWFVLIMGIIVLIKR